MGEMRRDFTGVKGEQVRELHNLIGLSNAESSKTRQKILDANDNSVKRKLRHLQAALEKTGHCGVPANGNDD